MTYQEIAMPNLTELDDWQLVNKDQDLRGRPLLTRSGEQLGIVRRMLVDCDHRRVAAVVLDNGHTVPVEDVEIRDDKAWLDHDGDARIASTARSGSEEEIAIPVAEERLVVGKREVERGRIHVRSHVVETPVHEEVRLRDEHVDVERRPVNERVTDTAGLFRDRDVQMTETDEEAVVAKDARVVEEVVVRKSETDRRERVEDSVRRTEVDVERIDGR